MGFFKEMVQSRNEWLNKSNTIPNYAACLNTNLRASLVTNTNANTDVNVNTNVIPKPESGTVSDK